MVNISKIAARKGLHLDLRFTDNELGSVDVDSCDSSAEKNRVNVSSVDDDVWHIRNIIEDSYTWSFSIP
jgi:hypothetical protein